MLNHYTKVQKWQEGQLSFIAHALDVPENLSLVSSPY